MLRPLRLSIVAAGLASAALAFAPSAFADSPHFLFADNSIDPSTGALNTAFKEAGLGTGHDERRNHAYGGCDRDVSVLQQGR